MGKIKEILELYKTKTAKECYKFEIQENEEPGILDNKIGGIPYLPIGEEYPLDKNGEPMILLVQINLENVELEDFPKEGVLEIFIDKDLNWPCDYQIRYFKNNLDYRKDFSDITLENNIIEKPLKLILEKDIEHMPINDYRFADIMSEIISEVTGDEVNDFFDIEDYFEKNDTNMYDEFLHLNLFFGNLGGYADFTQSDPRPLQDNPEKTECLIKIDSNLADEIMIGDSGIIFSLISKNDIKHKNFKNAVVDWDCY